MSSIYEQSMYAQQQRAYGPVMASSLRSIGPPSTTTAFMYFVAANTRFWKKLFTHTIPDMFKKPLTPIKVIVRLIAAFVVVMLFITIINLVKSLATPKVVVSESFANKVNIQAAINKAEQRVNQLSGTEGFQEQQQQQQQQQMQQTNKLLNIQPMTVKQAAFLGPLKKGAFDENNGIAQQLKIGIRSFFFNIDYNTKQSDTTNQPVPYEPVLLYKDNSGTVMSMNFARLEDTFKFLGEYAFNDRMMNHNDPVIVYLHFVRTPDRMNETDKYIQYIKKVSTSLNILNGYLAKEYYRSLKESDIFTQDIHTFDGKILLGTNIDTGYSKQLNAENKLTLMEDLDFKINFHYYKEDSYGIDATAIAPPTANAYIVKAMKLLNMSNQERNDWLDTHRNKFILIKDEPMNILNTAQVTILLNTFGVNVLPYDYFNSTLEDAKAVKKLYSGSWKMKPDILKI